MYYVNTRYYDPITYRFINSDTTSLITATPIALSDKNLFAYCDNNPVMRIDIDGEFWDTVWDVFSLVDSIIDVIDNPKDSMAWACLAGDTLDLIPFVTGVGEVTRTVKTADKIVDLADATHDTTKTVKRISDVADATKSSKRIFNISKQNSKIFNKFRSVKGRSYKSSGHGRNKMFYDWDFTHNDIEVYDRTGKHLGSMDPITGEMYKDAVKGRRLW